MKPAEKRDLINLIVQSRTLPGKYRFLLFDDKREVELARKGKTRDVSTAIFNSGKFAIIAGRFADH